MACTTFCIDDAIPSRWPIFAYRCTIKARDVVMAPVYEGARSPWLSIAVAHVRMTRIGMTQMVSLQDGDLDIHGRQLRR